MNQPASPLRRRATVLVLSTYAFVLLLTAWFVCSVGGYERRISGRLARMDGRATFAQVCALMREGSEFRYEENYHFNPQSAAVTEARKAGDCKDLAFWLAIRMNDPAVMFVEGRFDHSPVRHAWLEWRCDGQLWILDLTALHGSAPQPASQSHVPASDWYYGPDRIITRYGTFTANGGMSDDRFSELNQLK